MEKQRALATLGRTSYLYSHSESEAKQTLLRQAVDYYLSSQEVCDRLTGTRELSDKELLEMRSRLYLNLGLVCENMEELCAAKDYMQKALGIVE